MSLTVPPNRLRTVLMSPRGTAPNENLRCAVMVPFSGVRGVLRVRAVALAAGRFPAPPSLPRFEAVSVMPRARVELPAPGSWSWKRSADGMRRHHEGGARLPT
jgi:hypothetical protein